MVINTPRLCGEPGFRSHRDTNAGAAIQCREIVTGPVHKNPSLPGAAPYPTRAPSSASRARTKPLPPAPESVPPANSNSKSSAADKKSLLLNPDAEKAQFVKLALEALLGGKPKNGLEGKKIQVEGLADEMFELDFIDLAGAQDEGGAGGEMNADRVREALRQAGYNVIAQKIEEAEVKGQSPDAQEEDVDDELPSHDEL